MKLKNVLISILGFIIIVISLFSWVNRTDNPFVTGLGEGIIGSDNVNLSLHLDGISSDRKYEFETYANLTAISNCTTCNVCIDVYAPGYGVNSSCGINNTELHYKVGMIQKTEFNDTTSTKNVTTGEKVYINITGNFINNTDLLLTGYDNSGFPENISIKVNNTCLFQSVGILNGTMMQNDRFIDHINETLLFSGAGSKLRYINYSVGYIDYLLYKNLTFNITGGKAMSESLHFVDDFNSSAYMNLTASNVTNLWTWDDFCMGLISSRYGNTYGYTGTAPLVLNTGFNVNTCSSLVFYNHYQTYSGAGAGGVSYTTEFYTQTLDFDRYNSFNTTIQLKNYCVGSTTYSGAAGCEVQEKVGIKKDGTCYPIYTIANACYSGSGGCGVGYTNTTNFQFIKNSTTIKLYTDGVYNNSITYTQGQTLEMCISGSLGFSWGSSDPAATGNGDINATVYNMNISGLTGKNMGNFTWTNSTIVSQPLKTFTDNITIATMTVDADIPSGTYANYYLSPDGGKTWESVINGSSHGFVTQNNILLYKINLTTKTTVDSNPPTYSNTPRIYKVWVDVAAGYPTNVSVDIGNDGYSDWNMTGDLNDTESEIVNINKNIIESYITSTNCNGLLTCKIPISIYSITDGTLLYKDIVSNTEISKVDLNANNLNTYISTLQNKQIPLNITYSNGILNINNINAIYIGEENVKVVAHIAENNSINDTYNIQVRFTNYTLDYPNKVYYWELIPKNRIYTNVTPYGQLISTYLNGSIPIFNITNKSSEKMRLIVSINGTADCLNITLSKNITKNAGIVLSNKTAGTNYQIDNNITNVPVFMWGDFYNCSAQSIYYLDPEIVFNTYCTECVYPTISGD